MKLELQNIFSGYTFGHDILQEVNLTVESVLVADIIDLNSSGKSTFAIGITNTFARHTGKLLIEDKDIYTVDEPDHILKLARKHTTHNDPPLEENISLATIFCNYVNLLKEGKITFNKNKKISNKLKIIIFNKYLSSN